MKKSVIKSALFIAVALTLSLTTKAQVMLNFESGNKNIEIGNYWRFLNIDYDKSENYHISGKWSGKNTKISSSAEDTWILTPWIKIATGNLTFQMKLDATKNTPRGYAIYAIPYDVSKTQGEGEKIKIDSAWVTSPANNTILSLTAQLPTNFIGKLYKIRLCFVGMGSGSKTSVDNISIPGEYYSDPSNNGLPIKPIIDTDGDGVADSDDQFPDDPFRAYNTHFPATGTNGTLAFEDNWPSKGDYDFNDVVIDYNINTVTNAYNQVVEIIGQFTLIASGAEYQNGFGFQLDNIAPDKITSCTGSNLSADSYISLSDNGLEAGQSDATCIVFDNFFNIMHRTSNGTVVNTEKASSFVPHQTIEIKLTLLKDGIAPSGGTTSLNDLSASVFNYFIIANKKRGVEIHLPDRKPTNLANQNLFGKEDDTSSSPRYYRTKNNLPWAINIIQGFNYPTEKTPLNEAYPHLIKWAESGGTEYPDWYTDQPGYRKAEKIY